MASTGGDGGSAAHTAEEGVSAPFLREMFGRGFVHQCTDQRGLDAALLHNGGAGGQVASAYIGFDATATSLHVGNLLQLMMLRRFQQCGHRPVLLLGGGTTLVGDPSGRDASRQLLGEEAIARNAASLARCFGRFVDIAPTPPPGPAAEVSSGGGGSSTSTNNSTSALLLNNASWLTPLSLLPFLRDVGAKFPMSKLLGYEASARRLREGHPYTFLEFSYVLLQVRSLLTSALSFFHLPTHPLTHTHSSSACFPLAPLLVATRCCCRPTTSRS
jgi:tyrosyl-tRNA synthetase